jgi:hypothetical protein
MFGLGELPVAVPMDDGSFISEKVARTAELIQEYDHRLAVEWIPRANRAEKDDALRVIQHQPDGTKYVVLSVHDEDDFDQRVLARIIEGDNAHGDVQKRMEAQNEATRAYQRRLREEAQDERNQLAASILRSPRSVYKHGGKEFRDTPR